ncbi:hypothetical protein ATN79_44880 [Paraburkholderia caribensis]|nr:hypothetical protein ATN79_44880 [Paraburkholderia caribensis]
MTWFVATALLAVAILIVLAATDAAISPSSRRPPLVSLLTTPTGAFGLVLLFVSPMLFEMFGGARLFKRGESGHGTPN